jgi:drug/metabolite transporter (DMT)-like permease
MKPVNWRTASAFAALGLLWGSAWIPTSLVLPQMPGLRAGALRFAIAALFAALLALTTRLRPSKQAKPKAFPPLVPSLVLGVTMVVLPYALTVWAAGQVSPGVVATLFAFMPIATLLLSRDGPSAVIPALVIGLGGVAFLTAQGLSTSAAQFNGALLIAAAVAFGALSLNYAKPHLHRSDLPGSVAIQFASAAVLLGAVSLATEGRTSIFPDKQALFALVILGVAASGISLILMYWLLIKLDPWQVASLQWIATLIAVAESASFLRAKPSAEMWAGAALIVAATVWLLRQGGKSEEGVTLQITSYTPGAAGASESELGSK